MVNLERYDRQIRLQNFGLEAQSKLASARVLVAGAGGLGCPALQYLTAMGVGTIGLADDDEVALSNLQRQILYTSQDIGKRKTDAALERLSAMNPDVNFNIFSERITTKNAVEIIAYYDLVLDCTDNFPTRYLLDDACRLMKKPLIFGAIYQYEGQVAIFNVADQQGCTSSYRNIFPDPPTAGEVPDCNEAGVLGVLPGIIGLIQATEAVKVITGIGDALINKLMTFNVLNYQTTIFEIPTENLAMRNFPSSLAEFKSVDYELQCGSEANDITAISPSLFKELVAHPDTLVVDVREADELPKLDLPHLSIPLSQLTKNTQQIQQRNIIIVCQSGKRSLAGARMLSEKMGNDYKISHLEGGINNLNKECNE